MINVTKPFVPPISEYTDLVSGIFERSWFTNDGPLLSKLELIASNVFVLLLLLYIFVYRTYLDGYKLAKKNIITKKEIWKLIIPGKRLQYVKDLYLS